jgi:hypothetical protein
MTLLLIAQLVIASAPPLSPAEAAAVMARLASPANVTGIDLTPHAGPIFASTGARPTDGPFGPFPPQPIGRSLNCCGVYVHPRFGHARIGPSKRDTR